MTEITRSPGPLMSSVSVSGHHLVTTLQLSASPALKGCCILLTRADMITRPLQTGDKIKNVSVKHKSGPKTQETPKNVKMKIPFYAYFQFKSREGRVCVECNLS